MFQRTFVIVAVFLLLGFTNIAKANVNNDFGDWTFTTINVPLPGKFDFQEVINTRVNEDWSHFSTVFLRSSVAYHLTPHVSLWAGHDWFGNFNDGFSYENRVWEQVMINHKLEKYNFSHRIRQEERIFPNNTGVATLRYLARVDHPMPYIKNDKWSLIAWDEIFVNENSNSANQAGYAENRAFAGAGYKFNDNIALELGYMMQHLHRPGDDGLNHWLFSNLVINL